MTYNIKNEISNILDEFYSLKQEYLKIETQILNLLETKYIPASEIELLNKSFLRCSNICKAVYLLNENEYSQESRILIRSIIEETINIHYLFAGTKEEVIKKWFFYSKNLFLTGEERLNYYEENRRFPDLFKTKKISERCKKANLDDAFYSRYQVYCSYTHGDGLILDEYVTLPNRNVAIKLKPNKCRLCLDFLCLYDCLQLLIILIFEKTHTPQNNELIKEFFVKLGQIRDKIEAHLL